MVLEFWIFAGLAAALGFKHSFDADHLVAVSGILSRSNGLGRSLALGSSWAAGHLLTAALVSAAIFFLADTVVPGLFGRLELLVPLMLIVVGALGIAAGFRRIHTHRHAHAEGGPEHAHLHVHKKPHHEHGAMAGIGVVHGLASNDELLTVLLLGLGAGSWWQLLGGLLLFSFGVLAGMMVYSAAITLAGSRWDARWVPGGLTVAVSMASLAYGVVLILGASSLNPFGWLSST